MVRHALPSRYRGYFDAQPKLVFVWAVQGIQVTSWSGTAATSAREVFLPEVMLGDHRLRDLRLPAIDLSPIEVHAVAKLTEFWVSIYSTRLGVRLI